MVTDRTSEKLTAAHPTQTLLTPLSKLEPKPASKPALENYHAGPSGAEVVRWTSVTPSHLSHREQ